MCGIVLAVIHAKADKGLCRMARRDFDRAMVAMDTRGGDSWGVVSGSTDCQVRVSGLGTYSANGTLPILQPGSIVVGHTRFATKGEVHLGNAHPFQHLNLAVAHNGGYWAPIETGAWADCDSHALTGHIARAIRDLESARLPHSGYGTVVATDGEGAWVWRSGGMCHAVVRPWGVLVSSTPIPEETGRIVNIPDDEQVYLIDSRGTLTAWTEVKLAPRYTAKSWLDSAWEASPSKRKKRKNSPSSSVATFTACIGCQELVEDSDRSICAGCEALWGGYGV